MADLIADQTCFILQFQIDPTGREAANCGCLTPRLESAHFVSTVTLGVVAAACTQGKRTQHGKPQSVVSNDQPEAREGQAGRLGVAERFVVPTIGFKLLYAFVIVRLDRRDLVWINVTTNPTAEWVARQITEAFPWDGAPSYMIRDRDRIYGAVVTRRLRAMGIRDKPIAPASPWQNGVAERLIGSIRRECLDHIIVYGEAHLHRILKSYADYYNSIRTHRSLHKDAPISRPIHQTGMIRSHSILGGLHHHYVRV